MPRYLVGLHDQDPPRSLFEVVSADNMVKAVRILADKHGYDSGDEGCSLSNSSPPGLFIPVFPRSTSDGESYDYALVCEDDGSRG